MARKVDSYRFIGGMTKRMIKTWIKMENPREIPWTPLPKPLRDCKVALLSSAAIALKTDRPFDQEGERRNPWWGDPSYRVIPRTATGEDVRLYHLHVDPTIVERDLNCLLPLQRLVELEEASEIGQVADSHYSMMGYLLQPETALRESIPAIIEHMRDEEVDGLILVPA
jgi:D-proline reductase (dithiol) PrdB